MSSISAGRNPAPRYAASIARTCPAADGTSNPDPRPSFASPTPRITPRIRLPSRCASSSRLSTITAAPSDGTSPSACACNGRLRPLGLSACNVVNPA